MRQLATSPAVIDRRYGAQNMMDRDYFYKIMYGEGNLDYELYLNTAKLLRCQKDFSEFCNKDELQFQVVPTRSSISRNTCP